MRRAHKVIAGVLQNWISDDEAEAGAEEMIAALADAGLEVVPDGSRPCTATVSEWPQPPEQDGRTVSSEPSC